MTFESSNPYELMDKMLKMFRLDNNVKTDNKQRTASLTNNSNLERDKDKYTAKMISKVIQRTASASSMTTSTKIDEVGLLQSYLARYK